MKRYIILFLTIIMSLGCTYTPETYSYEDPKLKAAVQARMDAYAYEILSNCKKVQMIKADQYVDSVIKTDFNFRISDVIIFPEKPIKPNSLGKIEVSDTIKAKPIFKIGQDTI